MKKNNKAVQVLKTIGIALALPAAAWIIMELLAYTVTGGHVINSMLDIKNLVRSAGIAATIAFALSMNLTSGRMDLSLGSQRAAGTIVGGLLAIRLGLGGIWIMLFAIVFGILFGTLVGLVFVTLRIPPMVLGIGMACILECVGFAFSNGLGLQMTGLPGVEVLSDVNFTILILVIVAVFMLILMTYSKFSYEFRAVQGSQKIANQAGVNVFKNVVVCYLVAGMLVAVSGTLDSAYTGSMSSTLGLTSNGTVMANMFPMMIGCMFLSKYINSSVGVISAAFAIRLIAMGLTAFNISDAMSGVINMMLFIAFLVYQANYYKIYIHKDKVKRIAEAKKKRLELEQKAA